MNSKKLMHTQQIKELCITALFAAVICVLSPVSVPVGPVPISLATFAIYLSSSLQKPKSAMLCVIVYILLGAFGLPVFAGFQGGFQNLAGVTGGYIIGYVPLAFIVSLSVNLCKKKYILPLSMIVGTIVLYAIGTAWFCFQSGTALVPALASCVTPFLPGDTAKIVAVTLIALPIQNRLRNFIEK